jgi:hypothetical protein
MKTRFNKCFFIAVFCFLIFFNCFITFAQGTLFELPIIGGGGTRVGIIPDPMYMTASYAYTNDFQLTDISASIFRGLTLTEYDVGKTFTIYEFDKYPEFTIFVDNLTNGVNDRLQNVRSFCDIGGGGGTDLESAYFGEMTQNGIDFEGYQINSISLQIDSLTMSCNPTTLDQYWCEYSISGKLLIDAQLLDSDLDGVPDEQQLLEYSDLDMNGIDDREQNDLRCLYNSERAAEICVKMPPEAQSFGLLRTVNPDRIVDNEGKPQDFPFGLLSFRLVVEQGATVKIIIYFSDGAPLGSKWFKYDPIIGWSDFSRFSEFTYDRKSVVLELTDGGAGDIDGRANTIIIDPSGVGTLDVVGNGTNGGGGGGGCFIGAAFSGSN